jgi:hypothetical protein
MNKFIFTFLVSIVLLGCDKNKSNKETNLALTCLELTENQKTTFKESGGIPKGSFVSTKSEDECLKVGGIGITNTSKE